MTTHVTEILDMPIVQALRPGFSTMPTEIFSALPRATWWQEQKERPNWMVYSFIY